jgi:DnaJ-class molecular chaperone
MSQCQKCGGSGVVYDNVEERCYNCSGSGRTGFSNETCVWCRGSGSKLVSKNVTCSLCKGYAQPTTGTRPVAQSVTSPFKSCLLKLAIIAGIYYFWDWIVDLFKLILELLAKLF